MFRLEKSYWGAGLQRREKCAPLVAAVRCFLSAALCASLSGILLLTHGKQPSCDTGRCPGANRTPAEDHPPNGFSGGAARGCRTSWGILAKHGGEALRPLAGCAAPALTPTASHAPLGRARLPARSSRAGPSSPHASPGPAPAPQTLLPGSGPERPGPQCFAGTALPPLSARPPWLRPLRRRTARRLASGSAGSTLSPLIGFPPLSLQDPPPPVADRLPIGLCGELRGASCAGWLRGLSVCAVTRQRVTVHRFPRQCEGAGPVSLPVPRGPRAPRPRLRRRRQGGADRGLSRALPPALPPARPVM